MNLRTPICDLFGVRYPIVQTGMGYRCRPPHSSRRPATLAAWESW